MIGVVFTNLAIHWGPHFAGCGLFSYTSRIHSDEHQYTRNYTLFVCMCFLSVTYPYSFVLSFHIVLDIYPNSQSDSLVCYARIWVCLKIMIKNATFMVYKRLFPIQVVLGLHGSNIGVSTTSSGNIPLSNVPGVVGVNCGNLTNIL